MYLFNIFVLLLNSQIQHNSLSKSKSKPYNILFTTIEDIDYGDDIESMPIPVVNNENNVNSLDSLNKKYYRKLHGFDERYNNTIEEFINDKLLLNKIEGFLANKKLLDKLAKIIKHRNETTNKETMIYHPHESSDIFEQIKQYNNDNRNSSALTHDMFSGGLLNDW
jgi:hypothetical protein